MDIPPKICYIKVYAIEICYIEEYVIAKFIIVIANLQ